MLMLQSERNSSDDLTWRIINELGPPPEAIASLACGGIKGEAVQEINYIQPKQRIYIQLLISYG
jgi:hypothetical protein